MERKDSDGLDNFRKWLVPILLFIITSLGGILGSNVMTAINNLNAKVDAINKIINDQSVMRADFGNLKEKVGDNKTALDKLRDDFDEHKLYSGDQVIKGAEKRLKRKY